MPFIIDENEKRIQAIENKMLIKAAWVSLVGMVITACILVGA